MAVLLLHLFPCRRRPIKELSGVPRTRPLPMSLARSGSSEFHDWANLQSCDFAWWENGTAVKDSGDSSALAVQL